MTKLICLEAQNFKRLKAVRVHPNEKGLTIISGANAAGKSSVLDAIQAAIGGKKATPQRPIKDGEKKGIVVAELDDLIVTRTFTPSGGTLVVTDRNGDKIGSPQAVLDKLFGALTFDPLAFARKSARDQLAEVKNIAGLDLSELEQQQDQVYQQRRDARALLKDRENRVAMFGGQPEQVSRVDTQGLSTKLRQIQEIDNKRLRLESDKQRCRTEYDEIKKQIAHLEEMLATTITRGKDIQRDLQAVIEELSGQQTVEEISTQLESVNEINTKAQTWDDYTSAVRERDTQAEQVELYEAKLQQVRDSITATITNAQLPVDNMTIGDNGLMLNGIPFAQASQAEQIRASVEMGIGANPELRLILVRDGSLFDKDNLALLADIADQHNVQVLVERVGTDEGVGIIIEDGEVKS